MGDRRLQGMCVGVLGGLVLAGLGGVVGRVPEVVAEDAAKVGYVDVARLFDEYERTKRSDAVLEQKGKQKDAEMDRQITELRKMRESLELLNDEAREKRRREVELKADSIKRFRQHTAEDLQKERNAIAQTILGEIQQVVEQYAKANQFSLVLDARMLLYGQEAHDITAPILQQLNEQYAKRR